MTKENRHSIYSRMLSILLSDPDYKKDGIYKTGLCDLLLEASGITDYEFRNFPEIAKHKTEEPEDTEEIYYLWWEKTKEGTNNRIKVLEEAKKETDVNLSSGQLYTTWDKIRNKKRGYH